MIIRFVACKHSSKLGKMNIEFNYLNWNNLLSCISTDSEINVLYCNGSPTIFISRGRTIEFTKLDAVEWSKTNFVRIEHDEESTRVVHSTGHTYSIAKSGNIFRLDDSLQWSKSLGSIPTTSCIVDIPGGIAAVVDIDGSSYLQLYEVTDTVTKKYSKRLQKSNIPCALRILRIDHNFQKHFFPELAHKTVDILLVSHSRGLISILPLISSLENFEPQTLHFDENTLVDAMAYKNSISLVFKSGKIVLITYDEKLCKVNYSYHYLSTKVSCVGMIPLDCSLFFIWSDGLELRLAEVTNQSQLKFHPSRKPLYGVQSLYNLGQQLLAFTVNSTFYKLNIFEDVENVVTNLNSSWLRLIEEPDFTTLIKIADNKLNAISASQSPKEMFPVSLIADCITIDNKSEKILSCQYWSISIDVICDQESTCRVFPLERDLVPNASITVPVSNLSINDCDKIIVSFIGNLSEDSPNLYLYLDSVHIDRFKTRNSVFKEIDEITQKFFNI